MSVIVILVLMEVAKMETTIIIVHVKVDLLGKTVKLVTAKLYNQVFRNCWINLL